MLNIDNKQININIKDLLETVRARSFGYLNTIKPVGKNLMCTCPFHGNHKERHPSCGVNADPSSKHFGTFHCFACEEKGYITRFIAQCLNRSEDWVKNWLIENYYTGEDNLDLDLPEIIIDKKKKNVIQDNSLKAFESFHPYMIQRKLDPKVIKEFDIKYEPKTQMLVFPVRDYNGNIVMLTKRSVKDKTFMIDKEKEKQIISWLENQPSLKAYVLGLIEADMAAAKKRR